MAGIVPLAIIYNSVRSKQKQASLRAATDNKPVKRPMDLHPVELEELAANVYRRLNYRNVKHTGVRSSTDGGVDVWMLNDKGMVEIVQCKQLSSRVDRTEMAKFAKTIRQQHAQVGHYWAPNGFTQPAIDFAQERGIRLYDEQKISRLVERAFPPHRAVQPPSAPQTYQPVPPPQPAPPIQPAQRPAPPPQESVYSPEGVDSVFRPIATPRPSNTSARQSTTEKRYFGMQIWQIVVLVTMSGVFLITIVTIFGLMLMLS